MTHVVLPVSDVHHLLFIKPSSLGDIVHALPTLDALRSRFPQARITWLVKQEWAGFVQRVEGVDEICAVAPGLRGWFGKVPRLRAEGVDLAVDLQGLFRSGVMTRLSGAPVRLGFANAREGSPLFYSHRVAVPSPDMHAVDRYLLVAEALGAPRPSVPRFRLSIPRTDDEAVNLLFTRRGITSDRPWIAMNVSARWPTKRWPVASFAALIDRLQESGAGPVVLIGAPGERAVAEEVSGLTGRPPVSLVGHTMPDLLPALLRRAAVLVTNDSGPMHIAAAVGTPVVAFFGPTSPVRTGPYGASHQVLRAADVACSPCFSRRCTNVSQLECLTAIAPSEAFRAVQQAVERRTMNDER